MLSKIVEKLTDAMGTENLENLANIAERLKGRAIERKCGQSVEIQWNEKGYVRHINGSDNIRGVTPSSYSPE